MNRVTPDVIEELYINQQLPMHDVANALGISVEYVFNLIHKFGIKPRTRADYGFDFHHTEEHKRRLSALHKGKKLSPEHRKAISESKNCHFDSIDNYGHEKVRHGYIMCYVPDHPFSTKDGYVMKHRLIMEKEIRRHLCKGEVAHHKNHNRKDNRIENLELMTFCEHAYLHMAERNAIAKANKERMMTY